jgi:small-conductance mechanosensitive channel
LGSASVSVAYDSDVDLVSRLLLQAAAAQERVLADPGPSVVLMAFGADGLEFRLGYWIGDPENGSDNLRSLINLEILRLLRAHQIEIPFPQRVIHQRAVSAA